MFTGLYNWLLSLFAASWRQAVAYFEAAVAGFFSLIALLMDHATSFLGMLLVNLGIVDHVDPSTLLDPAFEFLDLIAWLLPVYPCLIILATGYAAAGMIRGTRWILSLIPFMATG